MSALAQKISFPSPAILTAANDNCHLRLVSNITPANTQALTYDTLNRLSTASGNYGSLAYGYDGNNNRTTQTFSGTGTTYGYKGYYIPGGDLLYQGVTGAVTQSIPYTAAGNVAGFSPALPSGITGVNYNKAEQLANVASGVSTVATYAYDGFGRRASKTVSGVTTYYIYAPDGTLLEEANGSGAVQVDYAYLPEYSFLPNSSYLGGRPIGEYSPVTKHLYYLHTDRLGSPIAATDHAGTTQWQATYQPFGLANITTSAITQDLRLPGQFYDAETGFHHNGAREYMPGGPAGTPGVPGGRYVQMDPLFLAGNRFDAANPNAVIGGLNPFSYANQNPGTWIDPDGMLSVTEVGMGVTLLRVATIMALTESARSCTIPKSTPTPPPPDPNREKTCKAAFANCIRNSAIPEQTCFDAYTTCVNTSGPMIFPGHGPIN